MRDLADALAATEAEHDEPYNKGSIDLDKDGAQVNNVVVDSPVNDDWSTVFALFNLNADEFEVVDDTVRMSTWQQSSRSKSGDRDAIQLYAYSARFVRRSKDRIVPEVVAEWRKALMVKPRNAKPAVEVDGGTYTIKIADPQLGKKRTAEAVENYKRGVLGHVAAARSLAAEVTGLHVAWMGDETENVVNNYPNQPHTIELNRSEQLALDYDLRVWTLKEILALGKPVSASSVISNHGEWTRNGGKDVITTQGDNSSTFIARQVKSLFDELEPFTGQHIDWYIGGGDPGVTITLSGVECYFSHGYIEKGKGSSVEVRTRSAIERQILGKTEELGKTSLWFMAHYHHFYSQEFEGRTLFGCPAIEAERSSEYMLNQFGVWSPPGVLGMLVGEHHSRGWSNLNVF